MIVLFLFALVSIAAAVFSFKKIRNVFLKYLLVIIFSTLALGAFWILWVAMRSGEM